jgi:hypothetical protein
MDSNLFRESGIKISKKLSRLRDIQSEKDLNLNSFTEIAHYLGYEVILITSNMDKYIDAISAATQDQLSLMDKLIETVPAKSKAVISIDGLKGLDNSTIINAIEEFFSSESQEMVFNGYDTSNYTTTDIESLVYRFRTNKNIRFSGFCLIASALGYTVMLAKLDAARLLSKFCTCDDESRYLVNRFCSIFNAKND